MMCGYTINKTMILIAHRGNIDGPNKYRENEPGYLMEALALGYHVELDLWYTNSSEYKLGHDYPEYDVDFKFLLHKGMWIHCKDYQTFQHMISKLHEHPHLNVFYHTDEDYVLTSQHYIWAYPDKPGNDNTICVMPEWKNSPTKGYAGICTDFVERYRYD